MPENLLPSARPAAPRMGALPPLRLPRSFEARAALTFGAIVVVLAVALSSVLGRLLSSQSQRAEGAALGAVAINIARALAEGLHERSREIQVLAESESLWHGGLDAPAVRQALMLVQASNPNIAWVGVADAAGTVRAATGDILVGKSVAQRPWFLAGRAGRFVGDVHQALLLASYLPTPAGGEPLRFVDFAAPIEIDGQTVGIVGMHGSWEWASAVVQLLLPTDAKTSAIQTFIFDRRGELLYAPPGSVPTGVIQRLPLPADETTRAMGSQVVPWADGRVYLTATQQVTPHDAESDLGWVVVAREPADVAFAASDAVVRSTRWIGAIAALLATLLAWLAAARLSRPLALIAAGARDVEQGAPGAVIPVLKGSVEIERLSSTLAAMTQRLLAANTDLESRVLERTAALEAANAKLATQAFRDPLTGLFNRRAFEEQFIRELSRARRNGTPLCVIMLDVDHFKRINDEFGHAAGDVVLQSLAAILMRRFRESDVVARIGGEEFVVLLPGADEAAARGVAESLLKQIELLSMPAVGSITVSAGVAALPMRSLASAAGAIDADHDETKTLLARADGALYEAKRTGRNRVCVAEDALQQPQPVDAA